MARTRGIWGFLAVILVSQATAAEPEVAKIGFRYPFESRTEHFVMTTSATVTGNRLTIGLAEEPDFKRHAMGFGFQGVMDGTEARFTDSDSAQVTVLWKGDDGQVVGRVTNATKQIPLRNKKFPAAHWKRLTTRSPEKLAWEVTIPEGAVEMNIVVVYTDTLTNPPHYAAKDRRRTSTSGDMPMIVASFTGMLEAGAWTISAQPDDLQNCRKFPEGDYPNVAQIEATVLAVKALVKERTGYKVIARPNSLDGISGPVDIGYRELQKKITDGIAAGTINSHTDSGFDVIPEVVVEKAAEEVPPAPPLPE